MVLCQTVLSWQTVFDKAAQFPPMLYILVAEVMLESIRKSDEITGFNTPCNRQVKIKAYADDTNIYVTDTNSIMKVLDLIDSFGKASGSLLNRKKTQCIAEWFTKGKYPCVRECGNNNGEIKDTWPLDRKYRAGKENWEPILSSISTSLRLWKLRNLTIFGKVIILNSIAFSKLWYRATNYYLIKCSSCRFLKLHMLPVMPDRHHPSAPS
jgi:hypothetical protein